MQLRPFFGEREITHNAGEDAVFSLQIRQYTVMKLNQIKEANNIQARGRQENKPFFGATAARKSYQT